MGPGEPGEPQVVAGNTPQYEAKAIRHPVDVVGLAKAWGCSRILFGINEPTLSWEYTFDVARLAKEAGLRVAIETNGFTTDAAIRALAPFVDAVDVGVKGSGDPVFYERWMHSNGAMETVKASLIAWREAGFHLIVGDLVAPPQMQSDDAVGTAQTTFYGWIRDHFGEHTLLFPTQMMVPGPQQPGRPARHGGALLRAGATDEDREHYLSRQDQSVARGKALGLPYTHTKSDDEMLTCHACGWALLRLPSPCMTCVLCTMLTNFCQYWTHDQYVTDGHCDNCGAAVPVEVMSDEERAFVRERVTITTQGAESRRYRGDFGPEITLTAA